ncbi:MAG: mechanosensitive ion channel family protein [Candidatus Methanomethylophilus sp.]|nr:mechanosensitive ion channel family protein [Methanomethylophilus sp.]
MYTGRGKVLAGVLAIFAIFAFAALSPAVSDDSSAVIGDTDLNVIYDDSQTLKMNANDTINFSFFVYNTLAEERVIYVTASTGSTSVIVNTSTAPMVITGHENKLISMQISADKYTHQGDYDIELTFKEYDGADPTVTKTGTYTFNLHVDSALTSDKYNKFLGWFPNTLDDMFGEPWFTALVSFFGLLAIGYAVMFVAVPVCSLIVMRKDDPDRKKLKKLLYRLCNVIVWLWVIGQVARILGMDEELIDFINRLFYLAYVIVGIIVAWKLWKLIVDSVIKRIFLKSDEFTKGDAAADFDSFRPLFLYIGEIFLAVIGTMLIMGLLGFNLTAIITSAGLVSLGISMGAQDVLKQFFSGLEILATRPFKRGDLVAVGTDASVYRVRRVNVMNTFLENWDNTDVTVMPNSLLTTNKIKNITRDTIVSKVYLTVEVGYGTDVNLARRLMQEAAGDNAHVILDGSVKRPYTRLEAFNDSNLLIKMGFYVDDYGSQWAICGQIRQTIIDKFGANGINIDYQQIVIHEAKAPTAKTTATETTEDVE